MATSAPKVLTDFAKDSAASLRAQKGFKGAKYIDEVAVLKTNKVRETYEPFVQKFTPREKP